MANDTSVYFNEQNLAQYNSNAINKKLANFPLNEILVNKTKILVPITEDAASKLPSVDKVYIEQDYSPTISKG